ncbi:hypothetical protein [Devosia lacusdianchii]|uniref:hypothetical protein n=1 Tax=Devosia lacusdianchii TaxID=2917991 RepID=UPI001F052B7F|nr:hypothetical protein [Devosia sp. JXJ CY 41]
MQTIVLHNRLTPGWLVMLAVKLGIGLLLLGAGVTALVRGNASESHWLTLVGGPAMIAAGLFDLRLLLDRRPQLTLTPEGLLDHRMREPRLVPWARVVSIFHDSTNGHRLHVTLSGLDPALFTGPGTEKSLVSGKDVVVTLEHVDVSFNDLERLVHQVAPGVVFSSLTRKQHDAQGRVG